MYRVRNGIERRSGMASTRIQFTTAEGVTYRQTDSGYCYRDGRRISREQFAADRAAEVKARAERMRRTAEAIKGGIQAEETAMTTERIIEERGGDMNKSACNVIVVDGHEYVHDFPNRKCYRDGEKITRAEFNRAMGRKPSTRSRRSKDVAFEMGGVTLTAKQADFMARLNDSEYCDILGDGVWVDFLQDEIGGQFADRPMTVGAMISTLREKGLLEVRHETRDNGGGREVKCRTLVLTEAGREIYQAIVAQQ